MIDLIELVRIDHLGKDKRIEEEDETEFPAPKKQ